jgi:nucleotide-binding universal stress UspA family protein
LRRSIRQSRRADEQHDRRRRRRLGLLRLRSPARRELATGLGDAVVFAYAVEPPFRNVGNEWREAQAALEELGRPILDAAPARAAEAGVSGDGVFVPKRPTEALLALAEERNARIIVVGSASERPLTGVILGSVSHKLVHRSSVPVLVVPPEG